VGGDGEATPGAVPGSQLPAQHPDPLPHADEAEAHAGCASGPPAGVEHPHDDCGVVAVDLDAAFAGHAVVKATLLRMTLHAVCVEDYPTFREAIEPTLRATRLGRFTATGLTLAAADALVAELLRFADRPRTTAEIVAWLEQRLGAPPKPAWSQLRGYAPMWHAPTGGPWTFGPRPSYRAAGTRPTLDQDTPAESLQVLVQRYLEGFGPASVADVAQFALVQRCRVKGALRALAGSLEQLEGPGGTALFDVPGAPRPAEDTPAPPRLMAMWDSILLAYADRGRVIPPALPQARDPQQR